MVENMKLITVSSICNKNFTYGFFKMKTDCPSFKNFEKLLREDDKKDNPYEDLPEVPAINSEWKLDCNVCSFFFHLTLIIKLFNFFFQNNNLFCDEAGVFMMTMEISQFIHEFNCKLFFNITYEVKGKLLDAKLGMNAGYYEFNSNKIFSNDLEVTQWELEKYKNLLAITSTSYVTTINLFFKEYMDDKKIENFFVRELKFKILKVADDAKNSEVSLK